MKPVEFGRADLTSCDREPIHVPASIQPQGCLLTFSDNDHRLKRFSANAAACLAMPQNIGPFFGMTLAACFGESQTREILAARKMAPGGRRPAFLFGLELRTGVSKDVSVHMSGDEIVIECESAPLAAQTGHAISRLRMMIDTLRDVMDIDRLVQTCARHMRDAFGYDRVMVYRFDPDWSGKVVAEAKAPELESFLGQHFPSGDIPAQARELYHKSLLRLIGDATYTPVPLEQAPGLAPLDMSFAQLRSVSPIHCEYLTNMGVRASMSISLIVDGQLWGLIAFHHYTPRMLRLDERAQAKIAGEFVSLKIVALLRSNRLRLTQQTHRLLDSFLRDTSSVDDFPAYVRGRIRDLADLAPCDGIGVWIGGAWAGYGLVPADDIIMRLVTNITAQAESRIWDSAHVAGDLPFGAAMLPDVAGVMVIPISPQPADYLFLFRREVIHTLHWGGDPNKTYTHGPHGSRLTPRKSFEIWKEQVREHSAVWTEDDMEAARLLRSALIEVTGNYHLQQLQERAEADAQRILLNEELSHRVKNILAVVQSLMRASDTDNEQENSAAFERMRGRISALSLAHDEASRHNKGVSLHKLVEIQAGACNGNIPITVSGPEIRLTGRAISVIALTFHEIIRDMARRSALSEGRDTSDVSWGYSPDGKNLIISWRENIPFGTETSDAPLPSALPVERLLQHELAGRVTREVSATTLKTLLSVPSLFVSSPNGHGQGKPVTALAASAPDDREKQSAAGLQGATILVAEDQILIAMEIEDVLLDQGAGDVFVCGSCREASGYLLAHCPDVALLDVSLGDETSFEIARMLRERHVPFLFATGYTDRSVIPEAFEDIPVILKPYQMDRMTAALSRLIRGSR
ncbi:GAF domain-containing protein [Acetobacter oeni]|uniref:histidine kinase n=1 Tax=Acetobacter oeni TaxID=304077 RepID=A0A511XHU3_9PROT|nr:GAF domain-containing protein [Acetobacter oeni]MBB3882555.1 light-regulated signal transduction histidine kinase (bacteriophytochrome) [Acetobacter oeni]NHO18634.1 GAF domain-containing protein [Acetobacter oeni]GBR11940.1 response regulator receiver:GAF [Acetobacter oeni LMG 21952]GEN62508.1 signal transduction histidine kinase [Acetobacter oeni]